MKYGKHTDLVEAFLTHLKSGNVDWKAVCDAWDASWGADVAWDAGTAARVARAVAKATAEEVIEVAAWAACDAICEIIGYEVLAKQSKPLVFLPMFGFESIEQLKEMVK